MRCRHVEDLYLTEPAVLALCRALAPIEFVDDRRIVAEPPIPLETVLGGAKLAVVKALSGARRPMTIQELQQASGLRKGTVWAALRRSPVVLQCGRGRYRLLGVEA